MRFSIRKTRQIFSFILGLGIGLFSISANAADLVQQVTAAPSQSLIGPNVLNLPLKDLQRFGTAIAQIKRYYIEPVTDTKLFEYAISGMLSNLDPHSDYLNAEALKSLEITTTGRFGGIGIEVVPENGLIKIISPIDGTPAYKAGIKAGDLIIRINNKLVADMTLSQVIEMIRGDPGSKVHLTIIRKELKKPLEIDLTREIIKIQTVKTRLLDDGYGYIRLSFFQEDTKRDLGQGVAQLKQEANDKLKGVILDLRNNPGGLLDAAVDVTNQLLNSKKLKYGGLIVYTKGRIPNADVQAKANGNDILNGIPMVVLINDGSASAAEIMAGALQDQKRATIAGETSFGKGSVQTVLPIDNDTAIKLTTALYYTPAGRSIQAKGIVPDISIPDFKIPKSENDEGAMISITEADLSRHLTDGNATQKANSNTVPSEESSKKLRDLLYSDFQLYEALNILKGLVVEYK